MQLYQFRKKPLIISYFDYATFFDSEAILDVMHEVYRAGVRGKVYRLLYRLNEKTTISVSTPVGLSGEATVSEIVGQGTVDGAVLSAVSIGEGVHEYFQDSPYETWYYDVRLQPAVFVDDIARSAGGRMEAQAGNNLMEIVTENKLLSFNHDKSGFMVVGSKEVNAELEKELQELPLLLCGKIMKRVSEYTYLGTCISSQGVSDSVLLSVRKKAGRVKQMIFEVKSIIEDCRNRSPGGFLTALQIWEGACIPYLFTASEMWLEMPKAALDILNSLQELFLRTMLRTPRTTPLGALYWDTGTPLAENRVLESKVLFPPSTS